MQILLHARVEAILVQTTYFHAMTRAARSDLAKGEVGRAAGQDAVGHGGQSVLAGQVCLLHARMRVHVHPGHAVGQLGGVVEHNHVVVQRQV